MTIVVSNDNHQRAHLLKSNVEKSGFFLRVAAADVRMIAGEPELDQAFWAAGIGHGLWLRASPADTSKSLQVSSIAFADRA